MKSNLSLQLRGDQPSSAAVCCNLFYKRFFIIEALLRPIVFLAGANTITEIKQWLKKGFIKTHDLHLKERFKDA